VGDRRGRGSFRLRRGADVEGVGSAGRGSGRGRRARGGRARRSQGNKRGGNKGAVGSPGNPNGHRLGRIRPSRVISSFSFIFFSI
jgi:hypothetical protein